MEAPLSSVRFAVVDVETSGRSLRWSHVLQVGVVTVDAEGRVLDRWGSLVAPRRRLLFRVGPRKLHGIRRADLRRAPAARDVLRELALRLDGAQFVAHNAAFDVAFLQKASARYAVSLPIGRPLCTLRLSRRLDPERRLTHGLAAVCSRYGVSLDRPHDAVEDAAATAAVLPHLLAAHGITELAQLAAAS